MLDIGDVMGGVVRGAWPWRRRSGQAVGGQWEGGWGCSAWAAPGAVRHLRQVLCCLAWAQPLLPATLAALPSASDRWCHSTPAPAAGVYPELLERGFLEQHRRLSISELQSGAPRLAAPPRLPRRVAACLAACLTALRVRAAGCSVLPAASRCCLPACLPASPAAVRRPPACSAARPRRDRLTLPCPLLCSGRGVLRPQAFQPAARRRPLVQRWGGGAPRRGPASRWKAAAERQPLGDSRQELLERGRNLCWCFCVAAVAAPPHLLLLLPPLPCQRRLTVPSSCNARRLGEQPAGGGGDGLPRAVRARPARGILAPGCGC